MGEYRVNLDIYNGPLDLLLYLIRREEVDIYDIPLARITEQYVQYVDLLKQLDPDLAGEFLVMAATLIEIKTRMLLPTAPAEGADDDGVEIDPRAELVRQLLEYKAFKDAAGDLRDAHEIRSQKFSRSKPAELAGEDEMDIEEVQVWDLFDAFSNLLKTIGATPGYHEVIYDDTPLELHAADIVHRLGTEGAMTFARIFEGRTDRTEIVGLFLAVLELVRRRQIMARQDGNFGEIQIHLNPNPPEAMDQNEAAMQEESKNAERQAGTTADEIAETSLERPSVSQADQIAEASPEEQPGDLTDRSAETAPERQDTGQYIPENRGDSPDADGRADDPAVGD